MPFHGLIVESGFLLKVSGRYKKGMTGQKFHPAETHQDY